MSSNIRFNIMEVFAIAKKIEENGIAFYEKAAALHSKPESDFLLSLAETERQHYKTFSDMQTQYAGKAGEEYELTPYDEAVFYLNSLADAHGGEGAPSAAEELTGKESIKDIILTAIGLEEKSITLYSTLKDMVREKKECEIVANIIAEEKSHIVALANELKKNQN